MIGIDVVEGRGRLVQDEQLDVLGQRLRDLHQLLLADADVHHPGDRVLVQADPLQQSGGGGVGLVPVDDAAAGALVAEEDVLGDGQVRAQRQFLVDDDDAALFALPDVGELADLAVEVDLAGVGAVRVHPGQHLHQRRFAGAVLAADGVDLLPTHRQADVLQRLHAGEFLGY